jgi:hypothetical protein
MLLGQQGNQFQENPPLKKTTVSTAQWSCRKQKGAGVAMRDDAIRAPYFPIFQ